MRMLISPDITDFIYTDSDTDPDISHKSLTSTGPPVTYGKPGGSTQIYDPARLLSSGQSHASNLAFLPILAILVFVICILLKAYSWSREEARFKARGDVEFGDDSEVNYGIIQEGDKEYCNIDMQGDGISVYDTVNSFRSFNNGFAPSVNSPQYYHDTVTSIKSLVLQRADGSQYDSVKSYKAFLEKITQDKDLAVEVKLLENYPIRSKSVEHCVVFEEESSEKSEEISSRMLQSLPLKKHIHEDGRLHQFDKRKQRNRRASGDNPVGMRKRSASNPTYRRRTNGAASLPSMRYLASSDSDEDDDQPMDRRKLWAERKKISRSVSGCKISKSSRDANFESGPCSNSDSHQVTCRRKRHYSADSARRHKKSADSHHRGLNNMGINKLHGSALSPTKREIKNEQNSIRAFEESSSENPNSSSDSNIPSDGVVSDTDDETKQNTLLSNASDDRTVENDVFFSLDSGTELTSSYEVLQSSPRQKISDTKKSIAQAKEEFFKSAAGVSALTSLTLQVPDQSFSTVKTLHNQQHNGELENHSSSAIINHSISTDENGMSKLSPYILDSAVLKCQLNPDSSKPSLTVGVDEGPVTGGDEDHKAGVELQCSSSPRRVQRFHVSFVNTDLSNPQPD
ncbi:hypothetical protein Btru_002267 [Bulinus truncatus]|nr:hypothetical protein Btru_002267 [Bulinus truncatus]